MYSITTTDVDCIQHWSFKVIVNDHQGQEIVSNFFKPIFEQYHSPFYQQNMLKIC